MPTIKDLEQLEKSQATLKEILKVNMLEPFKYSDLKFIMTHMTRLRKHECWVKFDDKTTKALDKGDTKPLGIMMTEGYLILELPQLRMKILYVKVFGGKGFFGKKIHYAVYQQLDGDKKWSPLGNFKTLTIAITSIGNIFRYEGLLKGAAI